MRRFVKRHRIELAALAVIGVICLFLWGYHPAPEGPFISVELALSAAHKIDPRGFVPTAEGGDRLRFGKISILPGLDRVMILGDDPAYVQKIDGYFSNTLFIGDSRTVGIQRYSGVTSPDYFCATGMSVFNVFDEKQLGGGQVNLDGLLSQNKYDMIFLMLGINELKLKSDDILGRYAQVVDRIIEAQPEARLYIQYNMHVAQGRSSKDEYFNNARIDSLNEGISDISAQRGLAVIDVNGLFDDAGGNLTEKYTFDQTHIIGKYYKGWMVWLYINIAGGHTLY